MHIVKNINKIFVKFLFYPCLIYTLYIYIITINNYIYKIDFASKRNRISYFKHIQILYTYLNMTCNIWFLQSLVLPFRPHDTRIILEKNFISLYFVDKFAQFCEEMFLHGPHLCCSEISIIFYSIERYWMKKRRTFFPFPRMRDFCRSTFDTTKYYLIT